MGYYKLRCGCVIKSFRNKDGIYQFCQVITCGFETDEWTVFGMIRKHPKSYGATQLSKFEVAILKLQGNQ